MSFFGSRGSSEKQKNVLKYDPHEKALVRQAVEHVVQEQTFGGTSILINIEELPKGEGFIALFTAQQQTVDEMISKLQTELNGKYSVAGDNSRIREGYKGIRISK